MRTRSIFVAALSLAMTLPALAADKRAGDPAVSVHTRVRSAPRSDIRVESNLVMIPLSVTDRRNRPVLGLSSGEFRVFEGKAEQKVLRLSNEDAPLSIGIVFDASRSMTRKLTKAREAVTEFLKGANPADEFFLVTFNSSIEVATPFTADPHAIETGLAQVACQGKTALLDAVYLATQYTKRARNSRKALLIISDGGDNHSRYTETEIQNAVRESDVWIYAIGIYSGGMSALPEEEQSGPELLADIAEQTGGRHVAVSRVRELPEVAAAIGSQLRNQYILAYRPENVKADGKYHPVQVKLAEKHNLHLSWRTGYYAPER